MNKKLSAMLIISIFLLSMIPLAIAQGGESAGPADDDNTSVDADDGDTQGDAAPRPLARTMVRREVRQEVREEIAEQLDRPIVQQRIRTEVRNEIRQEVRTVKERVKDIAPRKIAAQRMEAARARYQTAAQKYAQVREKYMEQRQKFQQAREKYKECKGVDSEDCNSKRGELKANAQPHLLHSAELILQELERMQARLESSEDLDLETYEEMRDELAELVSEVQAAQDTIEELGTDAPNEEYNAAVRTLRESWAKTKPILKKQLGRLASQRLGAIIVKTEILEKRLYTARDKLAEQGKDVSALDDMMEDFSNDLDVAADKYNEAKTIWSDANTPGEVDEAAKEIHELLTEAKDALKSARDSLRDIVQEIKSQNDGVVPQDDSEEQAEETSDYSSDETGDVQDAEDTSDDDTDETGDDADEESEEDLCESDADCDADEFCDSGECEDAESDEEDAED